MKKETRAAARPQTKRVASPQTLAIDIGGTGIKAILLDPNGEAVSERSRIPTPKRATPRQVIDIVQKLAREQGKFDRVSVGFPGVIKDGVVYTAANLGKGWNDFDLQAAIRKKLGKPVRVANDADVQGMGAIDGRGIELVITLGTGFGSVVFVGDRRIHLELGHHPFHKGRTYEDELGNSALKRKGKKKWNKHLQEAIEDLRRTFNFDRLYIGGGNTRHIKMELPPDVKIIDNEEGLLGGIELWREEPQPTAAALASVAERQAPAASTSGSQRRGGPASAGLVDRARANGGAGRPAAE